MSDAELRSRVNRLQMETQYKKLNKSNVDKGRDYVMKTIAVGTTIAAVTDTALKIYNNSNRIWKLIKK